jgi:hypothetical protein
MEMGPPIRLTGFDYADTSDEYAPGSLEAIFEEEPVPLKTFIQDRKFLGESWYLSPIQEAAVKQIERVYLPDLYPLMAEGFNSEYWAEDLPMKNLITLEWGKGSGKDHVCRIASLRVTYLLLCLRSPQTYFGMPEYDSIHQLNIAVNADQASRAFFQPLTRYVQKGWFADKAHPTRNAIEYAKNVTAISGHSDAESQEGLNLILGVADEIDAFREQSEMIGLGSRKREASTSAESILKMLKGSASTRFPYSYKRVAISYPRYVGSTIQQQLEEAKADIETYGDRDSIYFASGPHATWDVNPLRKGKDDFKSDYRKDPIEAAAMYECKPARAIDGYFKNMPALKQAVDRPNQPITVHYELEPMKSDETGMVTEVWNIKFDIADSFRPVQGARYAMHADLAINGDRAGIAMSHVERWKDNTTIDYNPETGGATESLVRVPILRNDFTIAFASSKETDPPREIQIRWARELAFELIRRGFLIVMFSFDQFQSADSMQILNSHGIETDRISADINDNPYKTLRDVAYDGRLGMPYSALLFEELERLNRVGKKIDHPPGGSKDLADALACSLVGAIGAMGEESVDGKEVDTSAQKFSVGEALAPLAGMGDTNLQNMMPIGMKGMSLYG